MRLALLVGVLLVAVWCGSARGQGYEARVTYYLPTGGLMRDETPPYFGAASCDWDVLPYGTTFEVGGLTFTCRDTGSLVRGWHVDLYAPDVGTGRWLLWLLGDYSVITVLEWGENPAWWYW